MISGFLQGFQILQCVSAPDKRRLTLRARSQRHICGRKPHFAYTNTACLRADTHRQAAFAFCHICTTENA